MNDRKDSIKEKRGVIGKININQLTEKDLKAQKRSITDAKEKEEEEYLQKVQGR